MPLVVASSVAHSAAPAASPAAPAAPSTTLAWTLERTTINPLRGTPPPNAVLAVRNGHIDWQVTIAPQTDFDLDWTPPPSRLPAGTYAFTVKAAGRITGGTTTQGFRNADAILLIGDRWVRQALGVAQNCVDPIGAAPITCTPPASNQGTFRVEVPTPRAGATFTFGVGALNCGSCYVRYEYAAKGQAAPAPTPPPKVLAGQLGIDYAMPERFGRRDPNGLVHYPTTAQEVRPQWYEVDIGVRRKDGRPCAAQDLMSVIVDGKPLLPARLTRTAPCLARARFAQEGRHSVTVRLKAADGILTGQRTIVVQDWLIFGLGDSNGSGEGTPDIPASVPGGVPIWQSVRCDRSANSYQAQAARALERRDPRTSVTFVHVACSGASIVKGLLGLYEGINPGAPLLPQLDQMSALAGKREIDAVILSIGINDLGFAQLVAHCLRFQGCASRPFPDAASKTNLDQAMQARLRLLPPRYARLAATLARMGIPQDRVYIQEYFDSTRDERGDFCNPLIRTPAVDFTRAEAKWAYDRVLQPINAAVAAAAKKHKWRLVSGNAAGFRTHGYCSKDPWIVGLTESFAQQGDVNGTLHSTTRGNTFQAARAVSVIRDQLYAGGRTRAPR